MVWKIKHCYKLLTSWVPILHKLSDVTCRAGLQLIYPLEMGFSKNVGWLLLFKTFASTLEYRYQRRSGWRKLLLLSVLLVVLVRCTINCSFFMITNSTVPSKLAKYCFAMLYIFSGCLVFTTTLLAIFSKLCHDGILRVFPMMACFRYLRLP